jgi:hypothetical protein
MQEEANLEKGQRRGGGSRSCVVDFAIPAAAKLGLSVHPGSTKSKTTFKNPTTDRDSATFVMFHFTTTSTQVRYISLLCLFFSTHSGAMLCSGFGRTVCDPCDFRQNFNSNKTHLISFDVPQSNWRLPCLSIWHKCG